MPESDFGPLAERLLRAGIAPANVRRLVSELETHYAALLDEERARGRPPAIAASVARTRLGSDDDIVAKARQQASLRSWGARWPLAVCALAPVLGLLASAALLIAALVSLFALHGIAGDAAPWMRGATLLVGWSMMYVLPLGWAWALARYAVTRRLHAGWVVTGLLLTAAGGALTNFSASWPHPGGRGSLSGGFGWSAETPAAGALRWLVSFALGLGCYLLLRERLAPGTRPPAA